MTAHEFLARMLFEFSYWHAMHDEPFKPRAYQLASEAVTALGPEVEDAWKKGGIKALKALPGIGQSIAEKIDEYFRTGHVAEYEKMKKRLPVDIWGLARIEGMGPKHILDLWKHLKIKNLDDLEKALNAHRVQKIPRFGVKSEEKIAKGLALMQRSSGRHLLGDVLPIAEEIIATLAKTPGVKRCDYAGSLRRRQETVGDIDLIATAANSKKVMDTFVTLPEVEAVLERGATRSSVRLKMGIDADLRVVPDNVYGATLQYFTGDKRHNVLVREFAIRHGFKLNEYGLFKGKKLIVCKTEEEIYRQLGMDTPPAEIRVGADEIEAAQKHTLPDLIPYGSVKGDLQVQTNWTDGESSIEEMAFAAKKQGLSYIAITDHTKSLAFINGLNEKKLTEQIATITKINARQDKRYARLICGSEVDILEDGKLDLPNVALAKLGWVGISVHSHFTMTESAMTKRILKAMANPNVDALFHPTGRKIGKREPYALDMAEVIAVAKKYRVALEIDAYPDRSDLKDLHVRMAVEAGVPLVIDSDAHAAEHFRFIPLGEAIARRGWATKRDIINTKSLKELRSWLEKKRTRPSWSA